MKRAAWPAARDHAHEMDRIAAPGVDVLQEPQLAYPRMSGNREPLPHPRGGTDA
jgi:hypothetical protein